MACDQNLGGFQGMRERLDFFDKAQGGKEAAIVYENSLVWQNGSNREMDRGDGGGLLMDASWYDISNPNEKRELLWYKIRYVEKKLDSAVVTFEAGKKQLTSKAHSSSIHGSPSPTPEELKYVKRLRHKVVKWNKKLEELMETAYPEPEPILHTEEDVKVMDKNRNEADRILSSLEKIEI